VGKLGHSIDWVWSESFWRNPGQQCPGQTIVLVSEVSAACGDGDWDGAAGVARQRLRLRLRGGHHPLEKTKTLTLVPLLLQLR
jgi:hypothetical protein